MLKSRTVSKYVIAHVWSTKTLYRAPVDALLCNTSPASPCFRTVWWKRKEIVISSVRRAPGRVALASSVTVTCNNYAACCSAQQRISWYSTLRNCLSFIVISCSLHLTTWPLDWWFGHLTNCQVIDHYLPRASPWQQVTVMCVRYVEVHDINSDIIPIRTISILIKQQYC